MINGQALPENVVVAEGDTLCTIAERLQVDFGDLQLENKLNSDIIFPGEVLKVPRKRLSSSAQPLQSLHKRSLHSQQNEPIHTQQKGPRTKPVVVQPGDTAWGISLKFGVSLEELNQVNKGIPDVLYPGDVLHLPSEAVDRNKTLNLKGVKARPKSLSGNGGKTFFDGFSATRDVEKYRRTHRAFLNALRYVESSNMLPAPKGDGGLSIGPLQISVEYHMDAWWLHDSAAPYEAVEDLEHAERTAINYWLRYCPWALEYGDHETLAKTHNGGPSYWRAFNTARYWRRVRSALRKYSPESRGFMQSVYSGGAAKAAASSATASPSTLIFERDIPLPKLLPWSRESDPADGDQED